METTVSVPTKFCTVLKTTKCSSWVVQMCITNPRWQMATI